MDREYHMTSELFDVKIGSKQNTGSVGRFLWSVSVKKDLVKFAAEALGSERVRAILIGNETSLYIQLGTEGSIFHEHASGHRATAAVTSIHLQNVGEPDAFLPLGNVNATFNNQDLRIEIAIVDCPDVLKRALDPHRKPIEVAPSGRRSAKDLEALEANDLFKTRPRDSTKPKSPPMVPMTKQRQPTALMLPESVELWNNSNVKKLKLLILDLQAKRPDIVFKLENGVITLKRQILEDI